MLNFNPMVTPYIPQQYVPQQRYPMQYGMQSGLPPVPYQMDGSAQGNYIFGNNYSAQGYGNFEFRSDSLTMGPAFSNAPLFEQGPNGGGMDDFGMGGFGGSQGGFGGGMGGSGYMNPMYSGGSGFGDSTYGGLDVFGQGVVPNFGSGFNDFGGFGGGQGGPGIYGNDDIYPFEVLPRGMAQSFNHYGIDQFGRMIGNFFDIASNGVDALNYRSRVVGPVDPATLRGSAYIANPLLMGEVMGVGPASFAQVTQNGAYSYGGASAKLWNNRTPGQVLLDYDGPDIFQATSPLLTGYGGQGANFG